MFGQFTILRTALIPSTKNDKIKLANSVDKKMIFPLDEAFGIDKLPYKISVAAMLEIVHWVQAIHSYDQASKEIKRNTAINLNEDTIRSVANTIGALVFRRDIARTEESWTLFNSGRLIFPQKKKDYDFYIETDGAMIHTRKPNEHKHSIAGEKQDTTENSDSPEHKSKWMENKLGMVFSSDNFYLWKDRNGKLQRKIGKREYISLIGPAEIFKKHLLATALRNGYGQYKQTILLSDGATWIRLMKEELFPDAQQILDYYHLAENVTNFAKNIFSLDETKYKPWAQIICKMLRKSKYNIVLKELNLLNKNVLSKSKFDLSQYILNNIKNIDYATYEERGWYIGSGAIESANRTVLQYRLKQAGMRWNQETGQNIVTLMSKAKSNLWETDVIEPTRERYEIDGAKGILGYTLRPVYQKIKK
jgi:hypothetical protein